MKGVEIIDPSLGNLNIMKLRNLKKDVPTSNPAIVTALPIPPKAIDPVVELFVMATKVSPSLFEASPSGKRKVKELSARPPKKPRVKIGETSSTVATELWKPELDSSSFLWIRQTLPWVFPVPNVDKRKLFLSSVCPR